MSEYLKEIDKYLDGEMTSDEVVQFEKRIAQDNLLAAELKLQKEMRIVFSEDKWLSIPEDKKSIEERERLVSYFRSEEGRSMKDKIDEVMLSQSKTDKTKPLWLIGSVAAVITLLIVSYFYLSVAQPSYQELYIQNIALDELPSIISRSKNEPTLTKGQLAFEDGNYQSAIEYFLLHQEKNTEVNPFSYVYLGISYLEINKYELALAEFKKLAESQTLESKKAAWYYAMVYLKQGEKAKLIQTLNVITSDTTNFNFKKSENLLSQIK